MIYTNGQKAYEKLLNIISNFVFKNNASTSLETSLSSKVL